MYCCKIAIIPKGEINERWFSTPSQNSCMNITKYLTKYTVLLHVLSCKVVSGLQLGILAIFDALD